MTKRSLNGLEVSAIGYGCMGLSMGYGSTPTKEEGIRLIHKAYELGCTFFDTAEFYGMGANEELLGAAIKELRHKVVVSTKFWIQQSAEELRATGLKQDLRKRLEASLKRLGTDHVELYTQARVHKELPLEEVAIIMGDLIKEGKIGAWGLSQASADEIKRAHAVTPLTAIQSEYSIMARNFENEVIPTCEALGIGFVAFSPLANGFLSGKIQVTDEFTGIDARRVITRFNKENRAANQPLLDLLNQFAAAKNATPAQISLAWMLHKKDFIVPIPGSRKAERIEENFGAANITLSNAEYAQIEAELSSIKVHGDRKDEDILKLRTMLKD